jgi:hypothetical protein
MTLARAKCGATGRLLRNGMVLFVSAMDNDLAYDAPNPDGEPPWEQAPVPTDAECSAFLLGVYCGKQSSS